MAAPPRAVITPRSQLIATGVGMELTRGFFVTQRLTRERNLLHQEIAERIAGWRGFDL
jgi:hypothetical protein